MSCVILLSALTTEKSESEIMNKAILMGRLTRDPEMRTTANQVPLASFTLAIDRRFKNASGERQADFIPIVAWRQQAEFASRFLHKGSRVAVVGSIQVRNWEDADGNRRITTEVVADELHFADSKPSGGYDNGPSGQDNQNNTPRKSNDDGFFPGPDDDTALPFDL